MNVFRQQPVAVAIPQRIVEHADGFLAAVKLPPCVDQPEPTDQKSRLWQAEVVCADITHNVLAAYKFPLDGFDRSHESWIAYFQQPDLRQQQHAGIKVIDA